MSKWTKLKNHPVRFIRDSKIVRLIPFFQQLFVKHQAEKAESKKALKPQSLYFNQLIQFKNSFPVNSLKFKDDYFWPHLRNELMIQLNTAWMKQIKNEQNFNPYLSQLCRPSNMNPDSRKRMVEEYNCLDVEDLKFEKQDVLIFTNLNSVDHVRVGKKYFNRILDPIYEELSLSYKVKKIEIIKASSKSIEKIESYTYKPICMLPPKRHTLGHHLDSEFPNSFYSVYRSNITYVPNDKERINSFIDWQISMTEYYKSILEKFMPKLVLLHPYYYYTPLINAASELGIKTVDVQHGLQFGYNPLFYSNWEEIPRGGYKSLPDYFWVWGEKEARNIKATFPGHDVITGGYPWLDRQLEFTEDDKYIKKIIKKTESYKSVALICLQIKAELPQKILNMINETKGEVAWLIRRHPKGEGVEELFSSQPKNVFFGDYVDTPILGRLFRVADIHFSSGSTTIIEADYYGVYSYVYGDEGRLNFVDEILSGCIGDVNNYLTFKDLPYIEKSEDNPKVKHFVRPNVIKSISDLIQ